MKSQIWLIAVLVLLVIALIALPACGATTETTPTVTPPSSIPPLNTSSTTSESVNGLILSLSLNATTFQPGQEISVVIDEQNTLATVNNVSASNNWSLAGLSLGPCGTPYPFGVAIFQGYYTSSNVSSATPLHLYNPWGLYSCPVVLSANAYVFQPLSDSASVIVNCESNPCFTYPYLTDFKISSEITETGYWPADRAYAGREATLSNFTPGVYTVVAGDEWGALAVLHFVVQGNDKSTPAT